jgi:uncharacterized damage-inducible protein DinB
MGFLTQTRQLLLYTLWADRAALAAIRPVRSEDLSRDAGVSFGSVLGTLVHILGSERLWLSRFTGQTAPSLPSVEDFPNFLSLAVAWEETAAEMEFFLASFTEDQLAAEITWTSTEGVTYSAPLWQPVTHMVNHATYHRGQVASLLRQLGYQPPTTDMIWYFLK